MQRFCEPVCHFGEKQDKESIIDIRCNDGKAFLAEVQKPVERIQKQHNRMTRLSPIILSAREEGSLPELVYPAQQHSRCQTRRGAMFRPAGAG